MVDTDYYQVVFGMPLLHAGSDWEQIAELGPLLTQEDGLRWLEGLRQSAAAWWRGAEEQFPRRVRELMVRTGHELGLRYASAASPFAVAVREEARGVGGGAWGEGKTGSLLGSRDRELLLPNLVRARHLAGEAVLVGTTTGPGLGLARALYEGTELATIHLVARWGVPLPSEKGAVGGGTPTFERWRCPGFQDIEEATEHVESWAGPTALPLDRVRFVMGTSRDDSSQG